MPVSSDRFLMCRPDSIEWIGRIFAESGTPHVIDAAKARAQWDSLYSLLTLVLKQPVALLDPVPGLPGLVLAADAGVLKKRWFVRGYFRSRNRAGEEPHWEKWFKKNGYQVKSLERPFCIEGGSEAVWAGGDLYVLERSRASSEVHEALSGLLRVSCFPLEFRGKDFGRLDSVFCPLGEDTALFYPSALEPCSRMLIRENIKNCLAVSGPEAAAGACSALAFEKDVILPEGCPKTAALLERKGFFVHRLDLSEFVKFGCGPSALALKLG